MAQVIVIMMRAITVAIVFFFRMVASSIEEDRIARERELVGIAQKCRERDLHNLEERCSSSFQKLQENRLFIKCKSALDVECVREPPEKDPLQYAFTCTSTDNFFHTLSTYSMRCIEGTSGLLKYERKLVDKANAIPLSDEICKKRLQTPITDVLKILKGPLAKKRVTLTLPLALKKLVDFAANQLGSFLQKCQTASNKYETILVACQTSIAEITCKTDKTSKLTSGQIGTAFENPGKAAEPNKKVQKALLALLCNDDPSQYAGKLGDDLKKKIYVAADKIDLDKEFQHL